MKYRLKLGQILMFTILCILLLVAIFSIYAYFSISTIDLNINKLDNFTSKFEILDNNDTKLTYTTTSGKQSVKLSSLPSYTPQAFISIEDKNFYHHHGLNYLRIIKASIKNIFSGYAKEGASTITQQLIKNTHLNSEKTLKRKFQEAALAKKLEKKYSKDEILNTYLNVIYFGAGAYGIEEASNVYFNHSASELSLSESATLAAIIKSPKTYSPINNPDKCKARRNLVLKNMLDDGKINKIEYEKAISTPLKISIQSNLHSTYFRLVIDEAMEVLNLSENDLSRLGFKIYTYLDSALQTKCDNLAYFPNGACVVIDNTSSGVLAFCGNATQKHQIGSLIKPILCYAPAFENGLLSPASQILDEKATFGDYSPQNADKKYNGWISVREALTKSLNVPAVKSLSYNGIHKSVDFAEKMGLEFSNQDNHLALALGASEFGQDLLSITNAYTTFARLGQFCPPHFIKKIESNAGKLIYQVNPKFTTACSEATAFLVNDILSDCVEYGTAKKLSALNLPLSAKTGTVGASNSSQNTDAWCISYSPEYSVGVWIGNDSGDPTKNLAKTQNGGTVAAKLSIPIWEKLKTYHKISRFPPPASIKITKLDALALQNQKLELASAFTPEKYIVTDYFNEKFLPKKISQNFIIPPTSDLCLNTDDNYLTLSWEGLEYINYDVYLKNKSHTRKIYSLSGKNSTLSCQILIPDEECQFYIISRFKSNSTLESVSKTITFIPKTKVVDGKNVIHNWLNKKESKL